MPVLNRRFDIDLPKDRARIGHIIHPFTVLRRHAKDDSDIGTELLYGQRVDIYHKDNGWALIQACSLVTQAANGYVGYVKMAALGFDIAPNAQPSQTQETNNIRDISQDSPPYQARISALSSPIFIRPDIKSLILKALPINSLITVLSEQGDFIAMGEGYIHRKHIRSVPDYHQGLSSDSNADPDNGQDYVSVAEKFIGRPYIWGGNGSIGVDCSGLVQMALCAVNIDAPRDADQQENYLGDDIALGGDRSGHHQRGDLIFWPGHVGIMQDSIMLLHANAYHMATACEPLSVAIDRIGPPKRAKRLARF